MALPPQPSSLSSLLSLHRGGCGGGDGGGGGGGKSTRNRKKKHKEFETDENGGSSSTVVLQAERSPRLVRSKPGFTALATVLSNEPPVWLNRL